MVGQVISGLVGFLGGFPVFVACLRWLPESLFSQVLSKNLEKYKFELKAVSELALEKFKDDLRRAAYLRETRFSHLHERVVTAIAEVAPDLLELSNCVAAYLSPGFEADSKEEKWKKMLHASELFYKSYIKHRIFLPRNINTMLEELSNTLHIEPKMFALGMEIRSGGERDPAIPNPWIRAQEAIEKIKAAFEALHDQMQALLGLDSYEIPKDSHRS